MKPPLPTDEDTNLLFDQVMNKLGMFDHSAETAEALARDYYRLFRDPAYCHQIGIPVQDDEFFHHEGPGGVAMRAHYYLHLKGNPCPTKFLDWRVEMNKELSRRRAARFEKWQRGD